MPRVIRNNRPSKRITKSNYRKASLSYLLLDFDGRCAYSMQKVEGKMAEVDHFDPRKKNDCVQEYDNLFLASRHCNGSKWHTWPTSAQQQKGIRFLNCCEEDDYGVCIFENKNSHELIGITPAAKWHIITLDLNAPFLVRERRKRAEIAEILSRPVQLKNLSSDAMQLLKDSLSALKFDKVNLIPDIPYR